MHKYPDHLFDSIRGKGFTIKETLDLDYFLGGYFKRVKNPKTNNNILIWGSKTHVKQTMGNFNNTFGFEPSRQHYVMIPYYNPELYITELCTNTYKAQY